MGGRMAITTYATLQTAAASWLHRSDLTSEIKDFIALAEADLQVRAKLSQWDTSATVSLTSGSGSLPSDFAQAISVAYGTQENTISYRSGEWFDNYAEAAGSGDPVYYTVRGSNLLVAPTATGDATLKYTARFTALSDSSTTNSLLTLFPDAYLNGTLLHACTWLRDVEGMTLHKALFDESINRIKKYMLDYKYPYGLEMRAA